MLVQKCGGVNFNSLYRSGALKEKLKNNSTNALKAELEKIEALHKKNNLHNKENVDIILNYSDDKDCFYGIISSKEQGVPNNPAYRFDIKNEPKSIDLYINWVNVWNEAFSKEELQKFRNLLNSIGGKK